MKKSKILRGVILAAIGIISISCQKNTENIVPSIRVIGISITPNPTSIEINKTTQLTATISPADATNKNISWKTDNAAVATVDANGLVTGKSAGTAIITVTTDDGGKTATCTVTVVTIPIAVTGVSITPNSTSIEINKTTQLIATISPADATNKNISWKIDNAAVATIDANGLVTGKSAGTAIITVTTNDGGKTATCTVTVTNPTPNYLVAWYISSSDNVEGSPAGTAQTMKETLNQIKAAKTNNKFAGNKKAVIVVNGTITPTTEGSLSNNSLVSITGVGIYPPIVLRGGTSSGKLDANDQVRVLYLINNNVTIADNITLTNGNTSTHNEVYGGGVFIEKSTLFMTGGTISNCTSMYGSGVFVGEDKQSEHSSFVMTGGTITGGKTTKEQSGAGVYIDKDCTFTLSGGFIINNGADGNTYSGGGVHVDGYAKFIMNGGEISGNRVKETGGGVNVVSFGYFEMTNGTITNNTAPDGRGSGVFVSQYGGTFIHTGGNISGNNGIPDIKQ
ncbi:MAG: Ig-like domain-containing protein [Prevotellaceae bacterium]|jgi:hypothetical protein|nr:Ig-like domain-containing protein [Prevotellaceae bacterium]